MRSEVGRSGGEEVMHVTRDSLGIHKVKKKEGEMKSIER